MTNLYRVEVFTRGQIITEHTVEAPDALTAINLVETEYGPPPQVEYKTIYHENGATESMLIMTEWHGCTFLARKTSF